MVSDCIIGVRVKNPSLEVLEQGEIILADGSRKAVPYAGPVQIRFKNRQGFNGALVIERQDTHKFHNISGGFVGNRCLVL
jgi:hypothetical protein